MMQTNSIDDDDLVSIELQQSYSVSYLCSGCDKRQWYPTHLDVQDIGVKLQCPDCGNITEAYTKDGRVYLSPEKK